MEDCRSRSRAAIRLTTSSAVGSELGLSAATIEEGGIKNRQINKKSGFMLKLQNEFAAVFSPRGIEESSIPRAGKIVLHVPRVEVVKQVEGPHAHSGRDVFSVKRQ